MNKLYAAIIFLSCSQLAVAGDKYTTLTATEKAEKLSELAQGAIDGTGEYSSEFINGRKSSEDFEIEFQRDLYDNTDQSKARLAFDKQFGEVRALHTAIIKAREIQDAIAALEKEKSENKSDE